VGTGNGLSRFREGSHHRTFLLVPAKVFSVVLIKAFLFSGGGGGHWRWPEFPPSSKSHTRQSRLDSGLGFQVKFRRTHEVVPSSLGGGY